MPKANKAPAAPAAPASSIFSAQAELQTVADPLNAWCWLLIDVYWCGY